MEDRQAWMGEMAQKIAFLDSMGIYHPWFVLEKAKYSLFAGEKEEALRRVEELWQKNGEDHRVQLLGAKIRNRCGQIQEAESAYRNFLQKDSLTEEEIYTASAGLAEILSDREEFWEARTYILRALRLLNTGSAMELLKRIDGELIVRHGGDQAAALTTKDQVRLGWCYIQTEQPEEGYAFFQTGNLLCEDVADVHWVKAVLALESGHDVQARKEAVCWRQCLLERKGTEETEEDEILYRMAQSFDLEGKALKLSRERLAESAEESRACAEAAMAAFDEAISRMPEDLDFLLSKMLLLREQKKYDEMTGLCERMSEIDPQYFWAYFYGQEAYEKLGKAQKVVDTFYKAKSIYAGRPEIYERAARVFLSYGQYQDAQDIIRQADENGAESFWLMVKKLELFRRLASEEEQLVQADAYADQIFSGPLSGGVRK